MEIVPPGPWRPGLSQKPPEPPATAASFLPQQFTYSVVALGVGAMMVPVVISMMMIYLPMQWMFGTNERG